MPNVQPLPASRRLLGGGKRNFRFLQKPTKNKCIPGFEADCLKCRKLLKMSTVNIHPPQTKCLICWPPTWKMCIMFISVKTYPLWSKISKRNIHKPWKTWVPVVISPNSLSNKFGNLPKPDPLAGLLEWMRGAWMSFCIYPLVVGLVLLWQCFWQKKQANGHWFSNLSHFRLSGKGQTLNPRKTRGVLVFLPVVYSVWSGLRFRHLIPWMLRVFPSNIIGGVPERHMFESEAQLSLDIRDFQTEPLLVLLDRVKCFDRIVPAVAVSALNSLGLPPPIGVAIQGFYSNQVRIMKLGKAFGKRLIHGSSALQGCTLSILMVNGIFSVLMAHLNKTCPQVQATTFIDDMKVWAKRENIGMLQSALAETVEFDRLTGQLISEEKTTVVSRREKTKKALSHPSRSYLQVQIKCQKPRQRPQSRQKEGSCDTRSKGQQSSSYFAENCATTSLQHPKSFTHQNQCPPPMVAWHWIPNSVKASLGTP